MRIYIDESGIFVVPQQRGPSFSLVLALVIPSASENELFSEFSKLSEGWSTGGRGEIKGSSLNEPQAAKLIQSVAQYNCFVEFAALDMGAHTADVIQDFKNRQADALTANLTPEHNRSIVRQLESLRSTIRGMPNQLFAQAFVTIELILETLQTAVLRFGHERPHELGEIAWFIDRKDVTITKMEDTWTTIILPMSENEFAKNPLIFLAEGDYSHFSRYEIALDSIDEEMAEHLQWLRDTYGKEPVSQKSIVDARRILSENQTFGDSRDYVGLQLADMLANILRRALNNRLELNGWMYFGTLLVRKLRGRSPFLCLNRAPAGGQPFPEYAARVARVLKACAKPI
jgi:hypothetical protein